MKIAFLAALAALATPALATTYAVPGATVGSAPLDDCVAGYVCLPDDTSYTFTIGAISYPPPFLQIAGAQALSALDILTVSQSSPPTGVNVTGRTIQMVGGTPTVVYTTSPLPTSPAQVTAVQLQRQLNSMNVCAPDGKTNCFSAANSAISGSGNADLQIQWSKATVFLRNDPNIATIGAAIGLTSAQVDQTFRDAMTNYP